MTIQQIQRLRQQQPFEPFRIVAADGSRYDVRHPENLAITGNGRIIVVAMHDYAATLDLLLVTESSNPSAQAKRHPAEDVVMRLTRNAGSKTDSSSPPRPAGSQCGCTARP
jgi:hypothetical protein